MYSFRDPQKSYVTMDVSDTQTVLHLLKAPGQCWIIIPKQFSYSSSEAYFVASSEAVPHNILFSKEETKIACELSIKISAYRKILKFGTPQTIAIIVLKIEKFDVTLH